MNTNIFVNFNKYISHFEQKHHSPHKIKSVEFEPKSYRFFKICQNLAQISNPHQFFNICENLTQVSNPHHFFTNVLVLIINTLLRRVEFGI